MGSCKVKAHMRNGKKVAAHIRKSPNKTPSSVEASKRYRVNKYFSPFASGDTISQHDSLKEALAARKGTQRVYDHHRRKHVGPMTKPSTRKK